MRNRFTIAAKRERLARAAADEAAAMATADLRSAAVLKLTAAVREVEQSGIPRRGAFLLAASLLGFRVPEKQNASVVRSD
jgi:hypothetical protein